MTSTDATRTRSSAPSNVTGTLNAMGIIRLRPRVSYPRACTFAQVSFSVSVRLNTGCAGVESGSGQK